MGGHKYVPFNWCLGPMPNIWHTAQWTKPARAFSIQGVNTNLYNPTRAPLGLTPHRIFMLSSYLRPLSPIYLPSAPTFPAPIPNSAPPLASFCLGMIECAPITWMMALTSTAYHTPRKTPHPLLCILNNQPLSLSLCPATTNSWCRVCQN